METPQLEQQSVQHLKDFKLAIEFKHLMKHAPGGVYLMPEFDDIRKLHGVIFVRRGFYRDGIFRFVINLPPQYNSYNCHPEIIFVPPIFNPLIDPDTGKLDLKCDDSLLEWQPERHFLVTALAFIKKIFYLSSYDNYQIVANEMARRLFLNDKDHFLALVQENVRLSLNRLYEPQPDNCTMLFSEPKPAHDVLREKIIGKLVHSHVNSEASSGTSAHQHHHHSDSGNDININNNNNNDSPVTDNKEPM